MSVNPTSELEGTDPFSAAATAFLGSDASTGADLPDPATRLATTTDQSLLLQWWPVGTSDARITLTQNSLEAASAVNPVFPRPVALPNSPSDWAIDVDGSKVSASIPLPGRPLARYGEFRTPTGAPILIPLPASSPAIDILLAVVKAMGQFHVASQPLVGRESAGADSLQRLLKATDASWEVQRKTVGDMAGSSAEIRRWLRCGNRIIPIASELLGGVNSVASTTSLIHGDLWPVNVLVAGRGDERTLTGITNWITVTEGSPLIDLAQLAVHTTSWSGALAESVLGAYAETGKISPTERRLLPVVAALDLVPRVGNLLHLAYVDDQMIGHESQPVLRSGMKLLLTSLENLTNVLAPETEWGQRKANEERSKRPSRPTKSAGGPRKKLVRKRG